MRAFLPLAAAVAVLGGCTCGDLSSSQILQRMETQEKYLPYRSNDLFADGRSMRTPPEGTIPRERLVGHPDIATGELNGQPVAEIPVPVTQELLVRGRHRYEIVCATCHGLVGNGDRMVADNMATRLPPSLVALTDKPAGFFYKAITLGFGLMPSFAGEIPMDERWAVVAYVRALQLSQNAPVQSLPEDVQRRLR
ncbi:MAG TPA: cytochrome c, partial [Myxococcaceae bacterium]|nr:cytochrome c [Myxococcaceae bacterium]